MARCFIKLGEYRQAMLLPFFLALARIVHNLLDDVLSEKKKNYIIESTELGLGELAVIIIPHIK